jgi:hypothetical protein
MTGGAVAAPEDADTVLTAVRLGWCLAEVRGRNRPGGQPGAGLKLPARTDDPLPLPMERDTDELRTDAQTLLGVLAGKLGVDADPPGSHFSDEVTNAANQLEKDKGSQQDWQRLAALIYKFDGHIQGTLATRSDTVTCGYQLGRALAECYWALDPSLPAKPENWASWWFLLGPIRCREISQLLGRLSVYFHPYTAAAIAGSLQIWQVFVSDENWQKKAVAGQDSAAALTWQKAADPELYRQIRRWYELIVMKQDPTTLIKPYQMLRDPRLVWRAARLFWSQLALAALAAAAVALFAWLLSTSSAKSGITTLLGVLGITGFSVAGLTAKLKNDAQSMITRVKEDAYTDLIAVAITTAPSPVPQPTTGPFQKPRKAIAATRRDTKMQRVARQRTITTVTSS